MRRGPRRHIGTMNTTTLQVQGMSCGSCIQHVRSALLKLEGVATVDVKLRDGLAIVLHDPEQPRADELIAALRDAGYASRVQPL